MNLIIVPWQASPVGEQLLNIYFSAAEFRYLC